MSKGKFEKKMRQRPPTPATCLDPDWNWTAAVTSTFVIEYAIQAPTYLTEYFNVIVQFNVCNKVNETTNCANCVTKETHTGHSSLHQNDTICLFLEYIFCVVCLS